MANGEMNNYETGDALLAAVFEMPDNPTPAAVAAEPVYSGTPRFSSERGLAVTKVIAWGVGVTSVLGVGGLVGYNNLSSSSDSAPSGHNVSVSKDLLKDIDCKGSKFVVSSNRASQFDSDAFLPHEGSKKVNSEKTTEEFIRDLFDKKNGPLAHSIDKDSLAAIMAAFVDPSHDGNDIDVPFNYTSAYQTNIARYEAPDGLKAALKDCNETMETLLQTAGFAKGGILKGSRVVNLQPVRDEHNNIVDMKAVEVIIENNLNGIMLKVKDTTKGLDGALMLFINPEDGNMYLDGVPIQTAGQDTSEAVVGPTGEDQNKHGGGKNAKNNNSAGGTFGTNSNDVHEGTDAGDIAENGGTQGVTPGETPSNGTGGNTGSGNGNGSGGNGGNGGGNTPPTQPPTPPKSTTTTSPPPPKTTTTTQPQPHPTTTTTPKGSDPGCTPSPYTPDGC